MTTEQEGGASASVQEATGTASQGGDTAAAVETAASGNGDSPEGSAEPAASDSGSASSTSGEEQHSGDSVQPAGGSSDDQGATGSGDQGGASDQAKAEEGEDPLPEVNDVADVDQSLADQREAGIESDIVDAELEEEEIHQLEGRQKSFKAADPLEAMEARPIDPPITYVTWLEGLVAHYRLHAAELRGICNRVGAATPELPHYPDYVPGE